MRLGAFFCLRNCSFVESCQKEGMVFTTSVVSVGSRFRRESSRKVCRSDFFAKINGSIDKKKKKSCSLCLINSYGERKGASFSLKENTKKASLFKGLSAESRARWDAQ